MSSKNNPNYTDGKHILAEFWQCQCEPALICHAEPLTEQLCRAVAAVGLTLVGKTFHEFKATQAVNDKNKEQTKEQTKGFTVSLLLAESHLCLHTWGETATVTLDIYVCNFLHDNREKADTLFQICRDLLKPKDYNINIIHRVHAPSPGTES